MTSNSSFI